LWENGVGFIGSLGKVKREREKRDEKGRKRGEEFAWDKKQICSLDPFPYLPWSALRPEGFNSVG
jgi:hypothetical protein